MTEKNQDKEYYLSTLDKKGDFLIYASQVFKLSEIDLINLIKICLIEARSKSIGKKILEVYRDSTHHRPEITVQRLKLIGLEDEKKEPFVRRKPKIK